MKKPAKLLTAVAAGLVLSSGAYAQEAAPVETGNLGAAVVSTSQAGAGVFGAMGTTGAALVTAVGLSVAFAVVSDEVRGGTSELVIPPVETPPRIPPENIPHNHGVPSS